MSTWGLMLKLFLRGLKWASSVKEDSWGYEGSCREKRWEVLVPE
jgi:hypothetical protein